MVYELDNLLDRIKGNVYYDFMFFVCRGIFIVIFMNNDFKRYNEL